MFKKKLLCLILACSILLSLTACVDRTPPDTEQPSVTLPDTDRPAATDDSSQPITEWPREPADPKPKDDPRFIPLLQADFDALRALDSTGVLWGWGPHTDDDNRSVACTNLQEKYGKYNAFFIGPNTKDFYLTFDEGYENGFTPLILDVLKEKDTPAVFYVTLHYAKSNPELIRRMIDEGHMVGNHSCTHPNFTKITLEQAYEEIKGLHDYMLENYDYTMSTFRYPEGEFNEQTLALLDQMGYRSAFWSFAYADWDPASQLEPSVALGRVNSAMHPGGIYLLHAVSKTNAEILGEFIDTTRAAGYEFKSFYLHKDDSAAD